MVWPVWAVVFPCGYCNDAVGLLLNHCLYLHSAAHGHRRGLGLRRACTGRRILRASRRRVARSCRERMDHQGQLAAMPSVMYMRRHETTGVSFYPANLDSLAMSSPFQAPFSSIMTAL
ncbi:hypothetical protein DFH94DRAFT_219866 [Russula ochroleuca]|uniref:Uncharacterized protein n=1 Tax=Russula ochroleuca TaxID=152965 RepID=A0A9P5JXF0_9AGAM|nr:hypothetical protein DFH94DRAFT_219866 [Russula ochroleuca]